MKTTFTLLLIILCFSICLNAQVQFEQKSNLISPSAYNKLIATNFNYLLLGENSPQQGISATLNKKKSNLKLNGLLYTGKRGVLSMEADLSSSNGVFFFDQNNGSEQGKITLNYYRPFLTVSKYYNPSLLQSANIKLEILELLIQAKHEYTGLKKLVKNIDKQGLLIKKDNKPDDVLKKINTLFEKHINNDDSNGFYKVKDREFEDTTYLNMVKNTIVTGKVIIKQKDGKDLILDVDSKYNVKKVLSAFQAKHDFILKKLQDSIHTIELNKSKTLWTTNKILFFGVSPFFERQSFNRFSYDESLAFKDMFKKERGSLYGITFSLNYSYERYKAYKSKYLPKNFFIRVLTTLNRASNFSNFKNTTLDIIGELGNDVNSNPITFENNDIAFVGDALYEFGFGSSLTLDMYYYPWSTPIGFFSIIGYNNIRFNRLSELDNIERYPMRLGLLFSLVNKEKNKPAVTVQAFIDRTDLNLSPNGNDNDLRFGIGIGLPINYN